MPLHNSTPALSIARAIRVNQLPTASTPALSPCESPFSQPISPTLTTQYVRQLHILQAELAVLERRKDWFEDAEIRWERVKAELEKTKEDLKRMGYADGRDSRGYKVEAREIFSQPGTCHYRAW